LHKGIKCDGDDNRSRMTKNSLTFLSLIFGMKSFIGPRGEGNSERSRHTRLSRRRLFHVISRV